MTHWLSVRCYVLSELGDGHSYRQKDTSTETQHRDTETVTGTIQPTFIKCLLVLRAGEDTVLKRYCACPQGAHSLEGEEMPAENSAESNST